jgi:hypothetical protein
MQRRIAAKTRAYRTAQVHRLRQLRVVVSSSRIASCGRGRGSSTLGVPGKCADSADGGRHTECASRTLDQSVLELKRAGTEQQVPATSRCELCRKLQSLESQPCSAVCYQGAGGGSARRFRVCQRARIQSDTASVSEEQLASFERRRGDWPGCCST